MYLSIGTVGLKKHPQLSPTHAAVTVRHMHAATAAAAPNYGGLKVCD
jgi:hypothetical protein